jgi:hypothetical protein
MLGAPTRSGIGGFADLREEGVVADPLLGFR